MSMAESQTEVPNASFWRGKRVLLTGHTGFKGGWLALWLSHMGARVVGISQPPQTKPSLFDLAGIGERLESHFCDVRDAGTLSGLMLKADPEIVFHLAAQPLVRASYGAPLDTFATNVMGTAHVLDAVRRVENVRVVIAITTDKVYLNREHPYPYRESDALGGHDPYSASKAAAELVIASFRDAYLAEAGVAVASARAGNVIGGGDWSADRLVPDAVRAWHAGDPLVVRRPAAVRPWQHVVEPISGYLALAEALWARPELAEAYNFGPNPHESATVRQVVEAAAGRFPGARVDWRSGGEGPHEASLLSLETAKARVMLGIQPRWGLDEAIARTVDWYARQAEGEQAADLCLSDIAAYQSRVRG